MVVYDHKNSEYPARLSRLNPPLVILLLSLLKLSAYNIAFGIYFRRQVRSEIWVSGVHH